MVGGVGQLAEPALLRVLTLGEAAVRLDAGRCAVLLPDLPVGLAHRRATAVVEQLQTLGIPVQVGVAGVDPRTGDPYDGLQRAERDLANC